MLDEQRALIESLKANLHRMLKWRFGPKSEVINFDQLGLFADESVVIERADSPTPPTHADAPNTGTDQDRTATRRPGAARTCLGVIDEIDVPEAQKTCPCCGERMSRFGHETSEQLHYLPARLEVHETRRLKYSCSHCHGAVVRHPMPVLPPIPKSMASASLLAYLIVSKFADGLPLYRIAGRLARLGIELSHTLMSEWLMQCAELLEELHRRMIRKVLDSGHIYTDDTTLPLQNDDPTRQQDLRGQALGLRQGQPARTAADRVRVFQKPDTGCAADIPGRLPRATCRPMPIPGYDPLFLDGQDHRSSLQRPRPPQVRGGGRSAQDARAAA